MKKLLAVLLAVLMLGVVVFSFASCDKDKPDDEQGGEGTSQTEETDALASGDVGDYGYKFIGAEIVKADEENDTIRIYYDVTNNGKITQNDVMVEKTATIDGAELDSVNYDAYPKASGDILLSKGKNMRPGATTRSFVQFKLGGKTAGTVVCTITKNGETLTCEFDLAKLPGAPKDTFAPAAVADPQGTKGMESSYSVDGQVKMEIPADAVVEVFDCDGTYNSNVKKLVRIKYYVTNLGTETVTPSSKGFTKIHVFQDDVALDRNTNTYCEQIESDNLGTKDLAPGATAEITGVYALYSDSPIEIEAQFGSNYAGGVFQVK